MKKVIKWTGIIILVLLVILISIPYLFKGKIISIIKEEANKNVNAKIDFGDFDLSLIRHFPNLSIKMEKLSVINNEPFAGDTLIYANNLEIVVDVMSAIKGSDIQIRKVFVDNPVMNFLVNKQGKSNWDISKGKATHEQPSQPSSFKASLNKYSVTNANILYDDQTMPFTLRMVGVNHSGSGDFTQDLFTLSTKTDAQKVDIIYGGISYISQAHVSADADLDMDMKNSKYTFKDNKIKLNELELGFSGSIAMPDTNIDMDLKFSAGESEFKNFMTMIPGAYKGQMKDLKSSGKMSFDGYAKGRYNGKSMPGFGVNLNIDNGMFQYTSLPVAVNNVFVDLKISNPDGIPDHTTINLSKMHVEMGTDPFDAKLILKTPVSDPDIDAMMKGKIDLGGISKIVPLDKETSLSGIVTADVNAKGKMSSIQQKKYNEFAASGNFMISQLHYSSKEMKAPFDLNTLNMQFNPEKVTLSSLISKIGKSDFSATGSLENFIQYAIKGETLKGNLNLTSQKIDLNEFMTGDTTAQASKDTTKLSVIDVPANIDFTMTTSIAQLIYENITITNVKGNLVIKDRAINMQNVMMQLMDGTLAMNGGYSTVDPKTPRMNFDMTIKDFDIQKTVTSFNTIEKMAPIAKSCSGKFSSTLTLNGKLDQQMDPVMNSLNGAGKLTTSTVTIQNFPVFNKVADVLKMPSLKKMDVAPISPSFKFVNGRVYVDQFDVSFNGMKSKVAGSNGFDGTIDYTMMSDIPRSSFGGAANSVLNGMIASANSKGANISAGETIPVMLKIGGTVNDPKISTDINKAGAKAMDELKQKAQQEFDAKKAEAEAKAQDEINKEKAAAQTQVDKAKKDAESKAKAQEDSLKKAATNKAQQQINQFNPFKKK